FAENKEQIITWFFEDRKSNLDLLAATEEVASFIFGELVDPYLLVLAMLPNHSREISLKAISILVSILILNSKLQYLTSARTLIISICAELVLFVWDK
ncbi:hypothetical protein ACJX0J_030604, partial [Zea mays]